MIYFDTILNANKRIFCMSIVNFRNFYVEHWKNYFCGTKIEFMTSHQHFSCENLFSFICLEKQKENI